MLSLLLSDVISQALAFLNSDELEEEVKRQTHENRKRGIVSLPSVVFNKKYKVDGAQCRDVYLQVSIVP